MAKSVNLKLATVKRVHYPLVGGMPMYVRVDGTLETGGTQVERSDEWMKMAERVQTSPNNIKRIFITRAGVGTEKHHHMTGSTGVRSFQSWPSEVAAAIQSIEMAMAGASGTGVTLTGVGLNAVDKPWVCSNIEEVYFDSTVLYCDELMNAGYGNLLATLSPNVGTGHSDIIKQLFLRFASGGTDEAGISKKFPRLKYVGYVSNLAELYSAYLKAEKRGGTAVNGAKILDGQSVERLTEKFTEHPIVSAAIRNPSIATHIWTLPRPRLNPEYITRPGIYIFDRDVLDIYFRSYSQQMTALASRNSRAQAKQGDGDLESAGEGKVSSQDTLAESTEKSSLEQRLDRIYASSGENALRNAIAIILSGAPASDRQAEYDKMSGAGKRRYGQYMKVKLDNT